ncbi:MAG TPA: phosphoribosyltransferase [Candidatus Baltobacteraceae bacterium]|nr:phosphoribosyltransferase [Candidatus Baltobacteraceae bacterium]
MPFQDRAAAGRELAALLTRYAHRTDVVVLGLPRGGVPVGYEVALRLQAPLDVLTVRKLGVPGHRELAMGAISSGGHYVLDEELIGIARVSRDELLEVIRRELAELDRREALYRRDRFFPNLKDKIAIVVDDGLATGSTMTAAVKALRAQEPARIVVAVPVGAAQTCEQLRAYADEVVCVQTPADFGAVGYHYRKFDQVSDDEVRAFLKRAADLESKKWNVA